MKADDIKILKNKKKQERSLMLQKEKVIINNFNINNFNKKNVHIY
jgi:hypothetical protein